MGVWTRVPTAERRVVLAAWSAGGAGGQRRGHGGRVVGGACARVVADLVRGGERGVD